METYFTDGFKHWGVDDITTILADNRKWNGASLNYDDFTAIAVDGLRSGAYALMPNANDDTGYRGFYFSNTDLDTIVIGFNFYIDSINREWACPIGFLDIDGNEQVKIKINSDNSISILNSSDTVLTTSDSGIFFSAGWYHLQIKIYYNETAGTVEIKLNNVSVHSDTNLNTLSTSNIGSCQCRFYAVSGLYYIADLYIANDFGGMCRIDTLQATGIGTTSEMTASSGDNYSCIDEILTIDTSDYVEADTALETDTYIYEDLESLGTNIVAVSFNITSQKIDSGTVKQKPVAYIDSTEYLGDEKEIPGAWMQNQYIMNQSPATSSAWTESEINSAEFGQQCSVLE